MDKKWHEKIQFASIKDWLIWKQLDIHVCGREDEETEASKLIDPAREEEINHKINGFSLIGVHVHGIAIYGKQFKGTCTWLSKVEINGLWGR